MQTVDRVVAVLEALAESEGGLRITDLAAGTGLPLGTLHRVLEGLARHGYVSRDGLTRRYRLGFRMLYLSHRRRWSEPLCELALGALRQLRDQTQETVFLAVLDGKDVVCAKKEDGVHPVRYFAQEGKRMPVHCTASAKVIAAYLSEGDRARLLHGPLPRYTARTVTEPEVLKKQLMAIRREGYVVCEGEHEPEVVSVAAPVLNAESRVVASVCLLGPAARLTASVREQAVRAVRSAAQRVQRELADGEVGQATEGQR